MAETSRVAELFAETEKTLRDRFRGWEADLPHQGEKGGLRERRVSDFLSWILPKKYGVGRGHIVDSQNKTSLQTDIVIYDAAEGIALPLDNYYSVFPCECVYAAIEVKSELTANNAHKEDKRGTIFECMKSTTQLRSLRRKSEYHDLPPILSTVFAYKTKWKSKQSSYVIDWLEKFHEKYCVGGPDIVFVLDPGFVLIPSNPTGYYREEDKEVVSIVWNPLLYFASRLIEHLSQAKVEVPNLWNEYSYFLKGKPIAKVYKTRRSA